MRGNRESCVKENALKLCRLALAWEKARISRVNMIRDSQAKALSEGWQE